MHVLVTGGAGFIGSHLVDRLLDEGARVVALDSFDPYYAPERKRRNVSAALARVNYRLVVGDIRDAGALDAAASDARPDVVVHLAARAGVRASLADPRAYVEANEVGTLEVLELCRRAGGLPLVFASSSSVYGRDAVAPFREETAADRPLSPYAATKRAGELLCHSYHHVHGLPVVCLRFFTVYGPRGRPDMAVAKFTRAALADQSVEVFGEGTRRDFTYIDDIVEGVLGAIRHVRGAGGFEIMNLGRAEPVTVRELVEAVERACGRPLRTRPAALPPGDVPLTSADVTRARALLGYEPRVSLAEGVRRYVDWVRRELAEGGPPFG